MKKKLHVQITSGEPYELDVIGNLENDILIFDDNNSVVEINLKEKKLTRTVNKQDVITLNFATNEGSYYLKEQDFKIDLDLECKKCIILEDQIIINYKIADEKINLTIDIGGTND